MMFKHGKRYFNCQCGGYLQSHTVIPVLFLSFLFFTTGASKSKVTMYLNNLFPLVSWHRESCVGLGIFLFKD